MDYVVMEATKKRLNIFDLTINLSALEVSQRNGLYKSTIYLLL